MTLLLLQFACLIAAVAITFSDMHARLQELQSILYAWSIAFGGCLIYALWSDDRHANRKRKGATQ